MEYFTVAAALAGLIMLGFIYKDQRQIHTLVNSNLSKVKADLEIALDRIHKLETLLTRERDR